MNPGSPSHLHGSVSGAGGIVGIIGGAQSPKAVLDAVLVAVENGDIATLREMQGEFTSVDDNLSKCVDSTGNSVVHIAATRKETATLQYVLENYHGDVNCVNLHGKTPLHEAARHNNVAVVKFLLARGARDSMIFSHTLSTPFHTACSCGALECAELLLNHAAQGDEKRKIEKVNELDKNKGTALHKCAFDGGVRMMRWLLDNGANIDAVDRVGCTPLLIAAKLGRTEICELLIASGSDVTRADMEGNTALHHCASRCLYEVLQLLLEKRAPVLAVNDANANSALHVLALNQRTDNPHWELMVLELIRYGKEELLALKNAAGKIARDYIPRAQQHIFSVEEVQNRAVARRKKEREQEDVSRESAERRDTAIAAAKKAAEARRARLAEEEQLRLREAEDRFRHEEDAKFRAEEEAEAKRLEEEEAKKAKKGGGAKEKGKSK